jgi:hypothetical protein
MNLRAAEKVHDWVVTGVCFSPNSKLLASTSLANAVAVTYYKAPRRPRSLFR